VDDAEGFHVERRGILGGIGHLHDRQRLAVAVEQQERLIPLAAKIAGTVGVDVERPSGDVDDLGRVERGARRGEHGVHGQRMVAARMGAPRSPATT
jgi:hypothetical protein